MACGVSTSESSSHSIYLKRYAVLVFPLSPLLQLTHTQELQTHLVMDEDIT